MTEETAHPPVLVTLPAEIDLTNAPAIQAGLLAALDEPGLVIADMSGTTFCDSAGLRVLVIARDRARDRGSALRIIIRPDGSVARTMAILGLDRMLPVYASMQDAVLTQADVP